MCRPSFKKMHLTATAWQKCNSPFFGGRGLIFSKFDICYRIDRKGFFLYISIGSEYVLCIVIERICTYFKICIIMFMTLFCLLIHTKN